MSKVQKCVICGKPIVGYGCNAEPVRKGFCCEDCNKNVVIPARFNAIFGRKKSS